MAQAPEKTFRLGSCHASVFVNEGESGSFRTVTTSRRYQDGEDWKTSHSYSASQLAQHIAVCQLALAHLLQSDDA